LLRELTKFRDAADFNPLGHKDVAGVIEAGSVRVHKLARNEFAAIVGGTGRITHQAFAQVGDDPVVLVQDGDSGSQVRYDDQALVLMEMARLKSAGDDVDGFVIQRVAHDALVSTVGNQQNGFGRIAQVDHVSVRIVHRL